MTYTHLTTNELVMIEAYYQEGATVSAIVASLGRSKQTIHKVINFLKAGYTAYEYYEHYKANKKRCGRPKTQLANSVKVVIQNYLERDWSLDVIKGTYPDKIPCSMRTLYRLVDCGIFDKEDLSWKGKRKPNGKKETRGKQAFRRDIRERAKLFPDFDSEFGHLEGDTIVGKNHKSAVITLVEKQSKAIITLQTNGRKASDIEESVSQWLSISSSLLPLIVGKSFPIGSPFPINMILIFSLRIQDVQGSEVLMSILTAY